MSNKVKWGILGAGGIARAFAKGLATSQTGELVAVGSRTRENAQKFGEEFNIPPQGRHGTYELLLADPSVQAVYVATPHPMHAMWVIRAAQAGKHILCEKPITMNLPEAWAVVEAARQHDVFLMEAFMYRCHPQTAKLIDLLRNGVIGDVRFIQASFGFQTPSGPDGRWLNNDLGGGGILDVGCYTVSMSRLIAGAASKPARDFAEPVEVKGVAHLGSTGVDEWAVAALRFPGDIVAKVSTSVTVNQEHIVRIFGSEGQITLPHPWTYNRDNPTQGQILVKKKGQAETETVIAEASATAFALEADVASRSILAGKRQALSPAMTWDDSLGNMRALDMWRESIGLTYEMEKPARMMLPVHGRPLVFDSRGSTSPKMPYGQIAGINRPISRLIMGVDNQTTMPHNCMMFDDFFERGGNCFDTAWVYGFGRHETFFGHWVKNRGVREQVSIITKGGHLPCCDPINIKMQFRESLERLQTSHADVYFIHRDNLEIPVGEFMDVLHEFVKAGQVKLLGASNWTLDRLKKAQAYAQRKGLAGFSLLSNQYSLAQPLDALWPGCLDARGPEYRKWLKKTQMPLVPWSSQARGFFTDRADAPAKEQPDRMMVRCWYSEDNFERRRRALELARQRGVEAIQVALAWVLAQPFPTFPVIGPRTLMETRSSLGALAVELTEEEMKWLNLERK